MYFFLLLITVPALYWDWQTPGLIGSLLLGAVLLSLFAGDGSDILGGFSIPGGEDQLLWNDRDASPAWSRMIRYRNDASAEMIERWGGRVPLALSGVALYLLSLYTIVFAVALSLHMLGIIRIYLVRDCMYVGIAISALALVLWIAAVKIPSWLRKVRGNHAADFHVIQRWSTEESRIALSEYARVCAGEKLSAWSELPFVRILPAVLSFIFHYVYTRDDLFPGVGPVRSGVIAAIIAFLAWLAVVLFLQAQSQLGILQPEKICPCRFVPLKLKLLRARIVRNGGPGWLDRIVQLFL